MNTFLYAVSILKKQDYCFSQPWHQDYILLVLDPLSKIMLTSSFEISYYLFLLYSEESYFYIFHLSYINYSFLDQELAQVMNQLSNFSWLLNLKSEITLKMLILWNLIKMIFCIHLWAKVTKIKLAQFYKDANKFQIIQSEWILFLILWLIWMISRS